MKKQWNANAEGVKYSVLYDSIQENPEVLKLIKKVKENNYKQNEKVILGRINKKQAKAIEKLTGINVENYNVILEAKLISHILKRHGEKGKSDHSMADDNDIAKMTFAIENYDKISSSGKTSSYFMFKNGKNRRADTVLYEKRIGDKSYYVVQAIVDTKAKSVYVVTAFIGESNYIRKKGISQLIDEKSPDATSEIGSVVIPNNKIPENTPDVNSEIEAESVTDNDIRYAIDDSLTDGFFDIGEDLFETDRSGELENLLKLNPEAAVSAIYNSAAKTAQRVLSESRSIKISDADYRKLARRVLKKYDVSWKLNPEIDKEFADKVKSFVEESARGSDFYASLDLLGQECKDMILLSGHYDEDTLKDVRENVLSFVKGKTLLVTEYQARQIREPSPKKQTKNLREKPNEKNDKYYIKLL